VAPTEGRAGRVRRACRHRGVAMPGTLPRSSAFLARIDAITPAGRPPASGSSTTARTVDMATKPRGIRAHTYHGNRGTVGAGRVAAVGDCPETRVAPPLPGA